jgi:hypothetical protein
VSWTPQASFGEYPAGRLAVGYRANMIDCYTIAFLRYCDSEENRAVCARLRPKRRRAQRRCWLPLARSRRGEPLAPSCLPREAGPGPARRLPPVPTRKRECPSDRGKRVPARARRQVSIKAWATVALVARSRALVRPASMGTGEETASRSRPLSPECKRSSAGLRRACCGRGAVVAPSRHPAAAAARKWLPVAPGLRSYVGVGGATGRLWLLFRLPRPLGREPVWGCHRIARAAWWAARAGWCDVCWRLLSVRAARSWAGVPRHAPEGRWR